MLDSIPPENLNGMEPLEIELRLENSMTKGVGGKVGLVLDVAEREIF